MGTKLLHEYLETQSDFGTREVSIVALAKCHKETTYCLPILAVDGMTILQKLFEMDDLEWIYGGQWDRYVQNFLYFVQRFREEGIELMFFFDSTKEIDHSPKSTDQSIKKLEEIREIFDHLTLYKSYPDDHLKQLPASITSLIPFALKHVCQCEVVVCTDDIDKEMALYASTTTTCFAILSQKSNHIIFNSKPYLSVAHLKLGTLRTIQYDRYGFAAEVGLVVDQLPLLSCLLGNDFVDADSVETFHKHLTSTKDDTSARRIVFGIAKCIQGLGTNNQPYLSDLFLGQVAASVGISREKLREGLGYYTLDPTSIDVQPATANFFNISLLRRVQQKHRDGFLAPDLYSLFYRLCYKSTEGLEHQKSTGLMPSSLIFRNLRMHLYGLLFNNVPVEIEEYCFIQDVLVFEEKLKPRSVLKFDVRKHFLSHLEDEGFLTFQEWRTVHLAFGLKVSYNQLKEVSPHCGALAILLNYLLLNPIGEPRLQLWEINAIIAQAVSPLGNDVDAVRNLEVPVIEPRAVHLATIILRGIAHVATILQVFRKARWSYRIMPWNFFDGKLFHYLYLMAKAGATMEDLVLNDKKALRDFIQLRMMSIASTYIQTERYKDTETE